VESLGAKFLAVEDEEFKKAETAGGYAKEMSKEYQAKQAALTAEHIAKQDIVITTALIPGRPAPKLVTKEMVASMKPGSVIVDLAVERGGNVEGAKAGQGCRPKTASRSSATQRAGRSPRTASALYAKNLFAFLETLVRQGSKALASIGTTRLVKATLTDQGSAPAVHPNFKEAKPEAPKAPRKGQACRSRELMMTNPATRASGLRKRRQVRLRRHIAAAAA
jgi:NAD(P) transhydrogenase subunit alpha